MIQNVLKDPKLYLQFLHHFWKKIPLNICCNIWDNLGPFLDHLDFFGSFGHFFLFWIIVQNDPKRFKMIQNVFERSKSGSKWSKNVNSDSKRFQMIQKGFKWTKKVPNYFYIYYYNFVYKEKKSLKWIFGALNDVNGISKKGNIVR